MDQYTAERKGPDGLTKTDRASLRDPRTLEVLELNPCRFIVSSRECFADFDLILGFGRFVQVRSNTGNVHDLLVGEPCTCLDKLNRRAGEACKHESVLEAVLTYRASQGEAHYRRAA